MFQNFGKRLLTSKKCIPRLFSRALSLPGIQVSVLGADTPVGKQTCFLLKQNPLITVLRMQGTGGVKGMEADLSVMDTRCMALAYSGVEKVPQCIKGADIVLVMGMNSSPHNFTLIDVLMAEGRRLKSLIENCAKYSPKAIIVICVPPISVSLPIAALLFKKTHWYHPGRLIGFSGLMQLKANSLLARYQNLDPQGVHVPMLGGPDRESSLPLFSRASPARVLQRDCRKLLARFRGIREDEFPKKMENKYKCESARMSEAFALNRMVTTICFGICGDDSANCSAFIRSNVIRNSKHTVSEVKFARSGVVHNYGIPRLNSLELKLLERAALIIKEREKLAKEFVRYMDTKSDEREEEPPFRVREKKQKEKAKAGVAQ